MGKNKLTDLNDALFKQLDKLSDDTIKGEDLKEAIERAHCVGTMARSIIDNATLAFNAQKALNDTVRKLPDMIGIMEDVKLEE
jgi:hypothetical protein